MVAAICTVKKKNTWAPKMVKLVAKCLLILTYLLWDRQIKEKGGVIPALNTRLYLIKRMKNKISQEKLKKVANSIWTSKLRYGLQLYAKVRTSDEDPTNSLMSKLQGAQHNLARVLENVVLNDRTPVKTLLSNQKMLSVNQISAHIKLTEVWKASNYPNFPIKITKQTTTPGAKTTRGVTTGKLMEPCSSNLVINSFIGDATRFWNNTSDLVKSSTSLFTAKAEIKKY